MARSLNQFLVFFGLVLIAGCAPRAVEKPINLVWPNPPETPRIKYIRSLSRTNEFGTTSRTKAWVDLLLGLDTLGGTMAKPYGVTTDKEGKVYVSDTGLRAIWVFDEKNKTVSFLGTSGQGALKTPVGMAVDSRGILFVADASLQRVYGFDRQGEVAIAIGKKDELTRPTGVAYEPNSDRIYVSDSKLHKIRIYNARSGEFIKEFGQRGKGDAEFNIPTNIFIKNNKLYVSDTGNFRIQVLDLEGNYLFKVGSLGDNPGSLARPKGVAVDSEGHIYIVDAAFDNFQVFDQDARLLLFVGAAGSRPGTFWLPAGMHIDEEDRIYVVDSYNRRVQVFQYLGEKYRAKAANTKAKP